MKKRRVEREKRRAREIKRTEKEIGGKKVRLTRSREGEKTARRKKVVRRCSLCVSKRAERCVPMCLYLCVSACVSLCVSIVYVYL